ncbi:hypothetical protein [Pauljensenia hongkongensis]|uniref:Uncharacterized protein n=1 Tax=Pauljensenia hongkongensis TaxID=178339 RepID=A0A1D8B3N8_9ACTO|nr:hypothetical protein [Pauljensenia hongkongensis]AOS47750.1 hypothetical protein BH719_07775 [Pauljensenia hongkongensis]EFW09355.1 hypothetical protein HMPREF9005_1665 [Actinomyces sp. oral taxon 178 str. F0338]
MLYFLWAFGGDSDGGPDDVPALLADLANTDDEHVDVSFSKGDIAVSVSRSLWLSIEDVEADTLPPRSFHAPDEAAVVEIARLLDEDRVDEILERYPWVDGYPQPDRDELLRTLTGGVLGSAPEAPRGHPEGPGPCDAADLRG